MSKREREREGNEFIFRAKKIDKTQIATGESKMTIGSIKENRIPRDGGDAFTSTQHTSGKAVMQINSLEYNDIPQVANSSPTQVEQSPVEYYEMGSRLDRTKKRGRCVILNYKTFKNEENNLTGTEYDVGAVRVTFLGLNFEVITHENKSKKQTEQILREESQRGHSEYQCFVLYILSHGDCGIFLCSDEESIEYENVFEQFANCSTLAGKPKLFFVEACQGDETNYGQQPSRQMKNNAKRSVDFGTWLSQPDNVTKDPSRADMFVSYAAYKKNFAIIGSSGSWFTQDLCHALNQFSGSIDIHAMLTKVNEMVSEREYLELAPKGSHGQAQLKRVKQIPRTEHTLRKGLKFY